MVAMNSNINSDPKEISSLISQGHIKKLFAKATLLQELNRHLYKMLPPSLRPFCQVINFELGTITIGTSETAVANQLHFQQEEIITSLKKDMQNHNIHHIKVKRIRAIG
jgi:hypothetical protein